jgi:hypothetical protein
VEIVLRKEFEMISRIVLVGLVAVGSFAVRAEDKPAASQPAKVEAVDFRKLKELMPADAADLKRTDNTGEKNKIGDFQLSTAKATFTKEGDNAPEVTIEIIDYGGAPGMSEGIAAWTQMEIDKDSDSGHEKTLKIKDKYPAYETFQKEGQSGNLQIYVAKRYIVTITTSNLPAEQMQKVAESISLDKLAELK